MRWILSIPLFAYLLVIANVVMLSWPEDQSMLNVIMLELALPSGREIVLTVSDALIVSTYVALYVEAFKATRISVASQLDHVLSLLVFIAALVQFLIVPRLGNVTFMVIMLAALMDVIIGFSVSISTAKRDITLGGL